MTTKIEMIDAANTLRNIAETKKNERETIAKEIDAVVSDYALTLMNGFLEDICRGIGTVKYFTWKVSFDVRSLPDNLLKKLGENSLIKQWNASYKSEEAPAEWVTENRNALLKPLGARLQNMLQHDPSFMRQVDMIEPLLEQNIKLSFEYPFIETPPKKPAAHMAWKILNEDCMENQLFVKAILSCLR